jgi:hypothetical protein
MLRKTALVAVWLLSIVFVIEPTADASPASAAHSAALTPGWDVFSDPLTKGKVVWNVPDRKRRLNVTFILDGALPSHEYTVGAHFFNAGTDANFGAGKHVGASAGDTRDGVTAAVDAWDFGVLVTDSGGDGAAHFRLIPNPGTYHVQFTVRIGGAPGCPETNCEVAYRTGFIYSVNTEEIIIPDGRP